MNQYGVDLKWPITSDESLQFRVLNNTFLLIYVTTLDHIYVRSLAEILGWNLAGGMEVCLLCYELSSRGFCVGLITRPEGSYRVWCV